MIVDFKDHSLISSITRYCEKNNLLKHCSSYIVGLSGGPDSTFLLHYLHTIQKQYSLNLVAAHLDHEWRESSVQDRMFCQELCQRFAIPFTFEYARNIPEKFRKGSKEEQGRAMRRFYLEQVRKTYNADAIALGHHAQDQQETFLIRLIRGTTLTGLCSMRPRNGFYIRPLLQTNKAAIVEFLDAHGLSYRIDPTNVEESFLRNRIRSRVIPALQSCDDRFNHNFLRTLDQLQQTDDYLQHYTHSIYQRITDSQQGLSLDQFTALEPYIQQRILLEWLIENKVSFKPSQRLLEELKRFILDSGKSNSHELLPACTIAKKKGYVYVLTD